MDIVILHTALEVDQGWLKSRVSVNIVYLSLLLTLNPEAPSIQPRLPAARPLRAVLPG